MTEGVGAPEKSVWPATVNPTPAFPVGVKELTSAGAIFGSGVTELEVTISELQTFTQPTVKPTPKPTKKPVTIVPNPSKSGTKIGVQNLKPGQKVKVTIKSGERP